MEEHVKFMKEALKEAANAACEDEVPVGAVIVCRGKIIGSFLGVLMFKIINNTLVAAKVPTFLTGAISGAIIIIAVLLQNVRKDKK